MAPAALCEEKLPLLHSDREKGKIATKPEEVTCHQVPARYVLAGLGFLGFFIMYSLRASLSVALVAMVNSTSSLETELASGYNDSGNNSQTGSQTESHGEFDWDETTQGLVLGAYFYGYAVPQLFGGSVAARLGGKNVLAAGLFFSAVFDLLLPLAARADVNYFIAIRVMQGLLESMTCPALNTLWGVWAPAGERGRLVNFSYAAVEIGTVFGMLTSGLLSQYGFAGGWPSVFYIHGMLGCVWTLAWMLLIHESPDKHPRLTSKERALFDKMDVSTKVVKTPWRHIATSPAVWAILVNHFMISWGFVSMATMLPTYMSNIQHFGIEQNGILSSLPFLAEYLFETVGSFLLDLLRSGRFMTTQTSRKVLNAIGGVLGAALFLAMGFVPEGSPTMAVIVITLAMGCAALCTCCIRVSHLDIAPRYAGILFGLTNGVASCCGFIAPAVLSALIEHEQTVVQWRIFFSIAATMYLVFPAIFCVFGKGEELWWAKVNSYERMVDSKENDGDEQHQPSGSGSCDDGEVSFHVHRV